MLLFRQRRRARGLRAAPTSVQVLLLFAALDSSLLDGIVAKYLTSYSDKKQLFTFDVNKNVATKNI